MCQTCQNPQNIQAIESLNKIPTDNWIVYYYVHNTTKSMSKRLCLWQIKSWFSLWNSILSTEIWWKVFFKETNDKLKAYVNIYFKKNWDQWMPDTFNNNAIAFAYHPQNWPNDWSIYFNESFKFWLKNTNNYRNLKKVFVHELWHVLNLWHSTDWYDVMYATQSTFYNKILFTQDTKHLLDKIYN